MTRTKRNTIQSDPSGTKVTTKTARLYAIIVLTIIIPIFIIISVIKLFPADTTTDASGKPAGVYTPPRFHKQGTLTFHKPDGTSILTLDLEIADNNDDRQTGMMRRDTMKDNESMLFVFEDESVRSFWMSNTKVPLDIIFLNSAQGIVSIQKNAVPYDESHYWSGSPAQYVVEVRGGFCDDYGIDIGDKLTWIRTDIWQK